MSTIIIECVGLSFLLDTREEQLYAGLSLHLTTYVSVYLSIYLFIYLSTPRTEDGHSCDMQ